MASQASTRKTFIDSSIQLARSNGFHGLDLDWKYPNTVQNMTNLGLLLNEWRAAVAAEATTSGSTQLLLSAAVYYSSHYYSSRYRNVIDYPISDMENSLDWINLMAYDFYGPSNSSTRPHADLNVTGDRGVMAWIGARMPTKKLVLGFPFYGYAWTLKDVNNHGLFAPASGAATAIANSKDGKMPYNKIKKFILDKGATTVYNSTVVSDYCYSGTTWISYDDTKSISTKVTYAKKKGLLGYFTWHVGGDENWILSRQAASSWAA